MSKTVLRKKTYYKIISTCLFIMLFSSCTRQVQLESDEYLLNSFEFKGNKQISTEELESYIPPTQKPNRRILQLPITPYVWLYNIGKRFYNEDKINKKLDKWTSKVNDISAKENFNLRLEKKRKRFQNKVGVYQDRLETQENWWMKSVGEPPAKITESAIKRTSERLNNLLFRKGFFDNKISYQIDSVSTNRRIKVSYLIDEQNAFILNKVNYEIQDSKIDSIIRITLTESFIKATEIVDFNKIDLEKSRIEAQLKDNGYYNFNAKNYIQAEIDTINVNSRFQVNLKIKILNPPQKNEHEQFVLESIHFVSADASTENSIDVDTTENTLNGIKYTFIGKKFPIKLLDKKILIRQNQVFKASLVNETNRQLYGLDQFAFANMRFTQTSNSKLRADIIAPTNPKYTAAYNFDVNNINSIFGGGTTVTFKARNLLSALETTELGFRANLEGQPGLDTTALRSFRSTELGSNLAVNFPKIIFLSKFANMLSLKNPRTQTAVSFNYSSNRLFERQLFRLTSNYSWQRSKYETILIAPFDINFINTPYKSPSFNDFLQTDKAQNLKVLYDPQFVSSINGSYIFNNQVQGKNIRARYLRFFIESAGTALNFFPNKDNINFIDKIFPLDTNRRAYFRFIKANFDFRKYFPINAKDSWAYRINVGVAQPYGRNHAMPFEKNFFIGGPNSIRAWRPRTLGAGSSQNTVGGYLQQPGDILLEGSAEYRKYLFRFFGNWNGALFVDAGNVWKWYQIDTKANQANFDFARFYKEFALGTGFGFRIDFDYFIARLDWGIKVFDPAKPIKERFVLGDLKLRRNDTNPYPVFNFAIGYPF